MPAGPESKENRPTAIPRKIEPVPRIDPAPRKSGPRHDRGAGRAKPRGVESPQDRRTSTSSIRSDRAGSRPTPLRSTEAGRDRAAPPAPPAAARQPVKSRGNVKFDNRGIKTWENINKREAKDMKKSSDASLKSKPRDDSRLMSTAEEVLSPAIDPRADGQAETITSEPKRAAGKEAAIPTPQPRSQVQETTTPAAAPRATGATTNTGQDTAGSNLTEQTEVTVTVAPNVQTPAAASPGTGIGGGPAGTGPGIGGGGDRGGGSGY